METPVPIPNTVVKHPGPMIVPTSAKVGIARIFFDFQEPRWASAQAGFFVFMVSNKLFGLSVDSIVVQSLSMVVRPKRFVCHVWDRFLISRRVALVKQAF